VASCPNNFRGMQFNNQSYFLTGFIVAFTL